MIKRVGIYNDNNVSPFIIQFDVSQLITVEINCDTNFGKHKTLGWMGKFLISNPFSCYIMIILPPWATIWSATPPNQIGLDDNKVLLLITSPILPTISSLESNYG